MRRIFQIPFSPFEERQVCQHPNSGKTTESTVRFNVAFTKVGKPVIMKSKVFGNEKKK